jgi:cob(I)alamin adenosyltransferase
MVVVGRQTAHSALRQATALVRGAERVLISVNA